MRMLFSRIAARAIANPPYDSLMWSPGPLHRRPLLDRVVPAFQVRIRPEPDVVDAMQVHIPATIADGAGKCGEENELFIGSYHGWRDGRRIPDGTRRVLK